MEIQSDVRLRTVFSVIISLVAVLVFFMSPALGQQPMQRPEPGPPSYFQRQLNSLGVDLQLPPRGRAIVVNIPAFELIAFEAAEPVLYSRVIVGAPTTPTPRLTTYTTSVRFRPTWRPTASMIASGEYRDGVRPPGPGNPLGLAAVRLAPGLLIYLHDTNRPEKFLLEQRALSHGCVRVQNWDGLVAWLLDLTLEQVHDLANGHRTFDIRTPQIPVIFGYYTRFPSLNGPVKRYENVYGLGDAAGLRSVSCAPMAPASIE